MRPLTKLAATPETTAEIPALVDEALTAAVTPHSGPAFIDFPMDVVFSEAPEPEPPESRGGWVALSSGGPVPDVARAAALLRDAERPVIMAGTNLYWGHGENALRRARRGARHPRLPQRPGARLRARRPRAVLLARALERLEGRRRRPRHRRADGLPARLRAVLRRGDRAGGHRPRRAAARAPARGGRRALRVDPRDPRRAALRGRRRSADAANGSRTLRAAEDEKRAAERAELDDDRAPLHPDAPVPRPRRGASTATRS